MEYVQEVGKEEEEEEEKEEEEKEEVVKGRCHRQINRETDRLTRLSLLSQIQRDVSLCHYLAHHHHPSHSTGCSAIAHD